MVEELEREDYRLKVILRMKGQQEKVDVDAKLVPVREAVGRLYGLFYMDFRSCRIEMGQDLLDDLFEEIIWFVTPERVKKAVAEWYEKTF
ncbi:MAG: hypothetical protein H0Z19_05220 [Archaeoglobus sp.]|uniref:hypothetical protein n=1 Tax=Archaeoglobus sp. TaxID=1872626 RepID=UPI001D31B76B|nr:hypothetical protein [Archaeoglobus sp.]MBO8179868.1 hypothetical protein [Archaeoglobus sp.]